MLLEFGSADKFKWLCWASITYLFFFVFAVIMRLYVSPVLETYGHDREIFRYAGWALSQGVVPYVDFFDHKPPFIFIYNAIFADSGLWLHWVKFPVFMAVCATAYFVILKRFNPRLAWLTASIYVFVGSDPGILQGGGLTRELSSGIVLVFLGLMMKIRLQQVGGWLDGFLVGILAGTVPFIQTEQVIILFPLIGWLILDYNILFERVSSFRFSEKDSSMENLFRKLISVGAGGLVPFLLFSCYLVLNGAIEEFIQVAILFNTRIYIPNVHLFTRLQNSITGVAGLPLLFGIFFIGIVFSSILKGINRSKFELAVLITLLMFLVSVSLSGRIFGHYFAAWAPLFALCTYLFCTFEENMKLWKKGNRTPSEICLGTLIFLAWFSARQPSEWWTQFSNGVIRTVSNTQIPTLPIDLKISQYLNQLKGKPGALFIMQDVSSLHYYIDYKILAPTKFIYQGLWGLGPEFESQYGPFTQILKDLDKHQTAFIYDCSWNKPLPKEQQITWDNYLFANYSPAFIEECKFLKRN